MSENEESRRPLKGFLDYYTDFEVRAPAFLDSQHMKATDKWPFWTLGSGEGLHLVQDGDWLRVFHKYRPELMLWEGRVDFGRLHSLVIDPTPLRMMPVDSEAAEVTELRNLLLFFNEGYPAEWLPRPAHKD